MSLGVQSYPELYTLLMGWSLYDKLWDILTQTGLAFLPFVGVILKNVAEPYESQEVKDAASTSLRKMELELIVTLFIIFIAAAPFLKLDPTLISYTPHCEQNVASPGNTNTTYDKAFTTPTADIRVPLWWYAVMAMSEGITSAANTTLSCTPNLRKMVTQVNTAQIRDAETRNELHQFMQDCYLPARQKFNQDNRTHADSLTTIQNAITQYGPEDTEWIGSHGFQDAYYTNVKASLPIKDFPYSANNDINADTNKNNPPAYDTPDCNTWWNDSDHGLKTKLYAALPNSFWDDYKIYFANDSNAKEDVVKKISTNVDAGYDSANHIVGDWSYSHLASAFGSWYQQLTIYPKIYAAQQAAPIIQALLLLLAYVFLPFAMLFASYRAGSLVSGAIIIFSLIFWTFIWQLVAWMDTTLMNALYGTSWFAHQTPNATLADMITAMMMIVAPLFWFSFMGAIGVKAGDIASRAIGGPFGVLSRVGDDAGGQGGNVAQNAASTAASVGMKML